jgi:hypothetical protein
MTYYYPNFGQLLIFLAKFRVKQKLSLQGGKCVYYTRFTWKRK